MPRVNPDILVWARETAGLTSEEAAAKLKLAPARGMSATERLAALESGDASPTRAMLRRMAERYRRPLITFYLAAPPRLGARGEDFRTLPEGTSRSTEAILDALVRNIRTRQAIVRAALEDEDEATIRRFVGSVDIDDGVQAVAASIQGAIGFSLQQFRGAPGFDAAFQVLRAKTERAGVFVLLTGDLGSHHTALDTDTFRGFAIADQIAPFVAINDRDARSAWSFTLVHELAHVWLGQSGISGGQGDRGAERFCNDVASEFLLPQAELLVQRWTNLRAIDDARKQVSSFAAERNISRQLVAYRLYRSGQLDAGAWQQLQALFRAEWLEDRRRQREEAREGEGGPNYYVVRRHRVGSGLINLTAQLLGSGAITTSKAGKILGVRPANVAGLIDQQRVAERQAREGTR